MKKLLFATTILFFTSFSHAQLFLDSSELSSKNKVEVSVEDKYALNEDFSSIDMIELSLDDDMPFEVFSIGDYSQAYVAKRWITPFLINRYETTYELWFYTKNVAEAVGYKFSHSGRGGSFGKTGGEPIKETENQPVTFITWYDAVVWCNALSEIHGLEPCYLSRDGEVLRDSTNTALLDIAICNWENNGYRLPTEAEWEYAARKVADGFMGGDLLSGQIYTIETQIEDQIPENEVAWLISNTDRTHNVGTAGTKSEISGTGNPNAYGIFDMSGNVLEYCWDWFEQNYSEVEPGKRAVGAEFGSERVCRGGSFSQTTMFSSAGDRYHYDPNEFYDFIGFRVVRTAN